MVSETSLYEYALLPSTVRHTCHICHQPFLYRYDGHYVAEQLYPIDWICRGCFSSWLKAQDVRWGFHPDK